jgi:hypothetical protein
MSNLYGGPDGRLYKPFSCVEGFVVAEYAAKIRGEWQTLERPYRCKKCNGKGCRPMRLGNSQEPERDAEE